MISSQQEYKFHESKDQVCVLGFYIYGYGSVTGTR